MRRLASKTQRVRTWILQDGKCALCGIDLEGFEVDHVEPFSKNGVTELWNLQALCINCHRSKTSEQAKSE